MSQPETAQELIRKTKEQCGHSFGLQAGPELARRVERMLALHQPVDVINDPGQICCECMCEWPCRTTLGLDGADVSGTGW